MGTKKMNQKSFWKSIKNKVSNLKKKISELIPNRIKRSFKRYGVAFSFMTFGAMGAHAAPSPMPEKNLADSVKSEILNNYNYIPSDDILRQHVDSLVYSEYGHQLLKDHLHSQTDSLGGALSEANNEIQSHMTRTKSYNNTKILNSYLGKNTLGILGNSKLTMQDAPSASCSWAGNRSIYYAAEKSHTEHLVRTYFNLLSNVNYAWAAWGFSSELMKDEVYKNLLHTTKNDKNIKQSLENDIKNHPTDIFMVFEYSPRARSGCHLIAIVGEEAFSYNNQSIGSSERRVRNMQQRGYFNLSEYIRQKVDENTELAKIREKVLQDILNNKADLVNYLAEKLRRRTPTTVDHLMSEIAVDMTMNNLLGNMKGNSILQEWQNNIYSNNQKVLVEVMASSKISPERKAEIRALTKGIDIPSSFAQQKDTRITEEEALAKLYQENYKASAQAIKKIGKEKSMSYNQRFLCLHTITTLLEKGEYIQNRDIQTIMSTLAQDTVTTTPQVEYSVTAEGDTLQIHWEQNLTKDQKIQQIQKKKTSWRKTKKATKMAIKRTRKELLSKQKSLSLADVLRQKHSYKLNISAQSKFKRALAS